MHTEYESATDGARDDGLDSSFNDDDRSCRCQVHQGFRAAHVSRASFAATLKLMGPVPGKLLTFNNLLWITVVMLTFTWHK